jgi:purine-binding chemotaxis protein CheW
MSEIKGKPKEIRLACFTLADQSYAIDIMKIRQIIRPTKIRPLPEAPMFVEGVINLRGAVIPIIDLRKRFGLEIKPDKEPRVIIVSVDKQVVGIVVDDVSEVISVSSDQIQPPPRLSGIPSRFLSGACPAGAGKDDILLILRMDEILTSEEKVSLKEMKKPREESEERS